MPASLRSPLLALAFLPVVLALGAGGACSEDTPADDDGTFVTTGVGGTAPNTGGGGATGSTGTWGHNGSGGAGGGPVGNGPPYPIVLAHGFFGFEEFAGVDFATYFFEVKQDLEAGGEAYVFTPAVDPFNDSTARGAQLAQHVDDVLAQTGAAKVILIGHSQGGLDARVVAHDHPDKVAAVITVATPHAGSAVSDIALGLVGDPGAQSLIDDLVNLIGAPLYDQVGNETSVTDALAQFSTPGIAQFNADYPDAPGVFYASIAGRTAQTFGGMACVPDAHVAYIDGLNAERDPTDLLFVLSEAMIADAGGAPNDGLVSVASAKHGEFWGCVPADHMDEIGQLFGDNPGLGNPFDHKALFRAIVHEARARGF